MIGRTLGLPKGTLDGLLANASALSPAAILGG